jgi:hypothetical protein
MLPNNSSTFEAAAGGPQLVMQFGTAVHSPSCWLDTGRLEQSPFSESR